MERIQNLLTKDNAYHLAASLGSGLVGARYLPISIKEAACISLITGAATAIGRAYLEGNTSKVKIVAVTLASIAATFFTATLLTNMVLAATLTPQSICQLIACNITGKL